MVNRLSQLHSRTVALSLDGCGVGLDLRAFMRPILSFQFVLLGAHIAFVVNFLGRLDLPRLCCALWISCLAVVILAALTDVRDLVCFVDVVRFRLVASMVGEELWSIMTKSVWKADDLSPVTVAIGSGIDLWFSWSPIAPRSVELWSLCLGPISRFGAWCQLTPLPSTASRRVLVSWMVNRLSRLHSRLNCCSVSRPCLLADAAWTRTSVLSCAQSLFSVGLVGAHIAFVVNFLVRLDLCLG